MPLLLPQHVAPLPTTARKRSGESKVESKNEPETGTTSPDQTQSPPESDSQRTTRSRRSPTEWRRTTFA
jgi:hypothetical protein